MAFGFFTDSSLTTPLSGNLICPQKSDGSSAAVQHQLWLGDPDSAWKYQADSDPGVDPIVVDIVDASPGSGNPDTDVKLATTQGGLSSATPGASLQVAATQITGGAVNAKEVWVEVEDSTGTLGTSTELSIETNLLRKMAV